MQGGKCKSLLHLYVCQNFSSLQVVTVLVLYLWKVEAQRSIIIQYLSVDFAYLGVKWCVWALVYGVLLMRKSPKPCEGQGYTAQTVKKFQSMYVLVDKDELLHRTHNVRNKRSSPPPSRGINIKVTVFYLPRFFVIFELPIWCVSYDITTPFFPKSIDWLNSTRIPIFNVLFRLKDSVNWKLKKRRFVKEWMKINQNKILEKIKSFTFHRFLHLRMMTFFHLLALL